MNGSRFITAQKGKFHARSVPPVENVDRRVAVGVISVSATRADEGRLAFAASTVDRPAGRAHLRRVRRINLDQAEGLVGQHQFYLMPADVQNGAVESALPANVLSWICNRAGGRGSHAFCPKTLNDNRTVCPRYRSGRFMGPVPANASNLGVQQRRPVLGLCPAGRPALSLRRYPLRPSQFLAGHRQVVRKREGCSVRQHQWSGHATVYAHGLSIVRQVAFDAATYGYLPAGRRSRDARLSDYALQRSGQAELDPPDLGKPNAAPAAIDLFNGNISTGKAEGVVHALTLGLRVTAVSPPCLDEGVVERLKGPLKRSDVNGSNEVALSAKCGQFPGLGDVVQVVARGSPVLAPMISALLKGQIPDQAAHTSELIHTPRLLWRRTKRVGEADKFHIKLKRIRKSDSSQGAGE